MLALLVAAAAAVQPDPVAYVKCGPPASYSSCARLLAVKPAFQPAPDALFCCSGEIRTDDATMQRCFGIASDIDVSCPVLVTANSRQWAWCCDDYQRDQRDTPPLTSDWTSVLDWTPRDDYDWDDDMWK